MFFIRLFSRTPSFKKVLSNTTLEFIGWNSRYFEDEAFIGYLKYLQYWERPEYLKFIMYPHCLFFLELLQNANFRNAMAHPVNKELVHRQQFYFWKNYRNNRLKHIQPKSLPECSISVALASAVAPGLPLTTIPAAASSIPPAPPQAPLPMQYGSTFEQVD
ncbi:mediator of RNA polymerase II transcription subunit 31-like [Salvia splendens]|uniref:mediator of RNA polymerase II transcription subunit 31-like n=1 Tax=Salvia splendens TaxID=180675 RepID=UPI001C279E75|nr:mediator of RNA polymerase II transcription subunit 31-like [Salvia splendens]XP_042011450.1 mediator of RNA polymerase II transcription subunit 31-like [Salvia splendens]